MPFPSFRFLRSLCLALLALAPLPAGMPASGRMVFRAYGTAEGLEHPSLTTLAQDAEGFLWVGTEGGAYRFDGAGFQLWSLPEGLPSAWVRAFGPAPDGGLWIGTRAGLCFLRGGRVQRVAPDDPLTAARIHRILADAHGGVWVAAESGLFRSAGPGSPFAPAEGWPGGPAYSLVSDDSGMWVGGASAVHFRDAENRWRSLGPAEGVHPGPVKAVLLDRAGTLWARTPTALRILRPGSLRMVPPAMGLPSLAISFYEESLADDGEGGVLIPTAKGLLRFDSRTGWRLLDEGRGLPGGWANLALVDRAGSLWVGSLGLHRLQGGGAWENFSRLDGLPADSTWALLRDRSGALWISTSGGLARMGPRGPEPFPAGAGLVLYELREGPDGSIWGAGEHPFLVRISPDRRQLTRVPLPPSPGLAVPMALAFDSGGSLWMGTSTDGLWRISEPSKRPVFRRAPFLDGDPGQITSLYLDAQGRLWATTGRGLARLDGDRWHTWGSDVGLRPGALRALAALPDGTAWVAYLEPFGLTRVDLRGDTPRVLENLGRKEGLASDSVYSLTADAVGRLWIGGPRGVQCMEGRNFRLYRREDGLASTDCNPSSTWADGDGGMWFGSTAGLLHHRTEGAGVPWRSPAVTLLSLSLGSRHWDRPGDSLGDVRYGERSLSARFSSLAFEHEGRLRFQGRLEGLEKEWSDLPGSELRYPALPSGNYRLGVRAVLEGAEPGPAVTVTFRVLPPWWRRGWAWLLWTGLLGAAGAAVLRWRVRWLRRRNDELELLVYERTEALELSNLALTTISGTDPLTGLRNRRYLSEELPPAMGLALRARRNHPGPGLPVDGCLVFAMLDVDHFKRINDTWTHAAGDLALKELADVLKREARASDFLVRWGGEEILFVGHTADFAGAAAAVNRLHHAIRTHPFDLGQATPVALTCSIGFSLFPFQPDRTDAADWESQVRLADRCLYAAKRSGRDAWLGVTARPGGPADLVARFGEAPDRWIQEGAVEFLAGPRQLDVVWS
ncbi:ligand-binding sensor domain-containing diguanylate cyclase [Geothrix sp. 21YS21S-4]|uniref:ligand-binding sensor domain-containing diguanylate cyclase n=1 Tax=Geothrix sp. 21YS21S-4 TaxID=3068889 RepID=UPI0027B89E45|nr:ligand-binding sensor domain-containing diguanylate cyclase [Geothrix sp. 21YS21S-4]